MQAKTGRIIINLTEVYSTAKGLQTHWAEAPKQVPEIFARFMAMIEATKDGGGLFVGQTSPILRSLLPHELQVALE